MNDRSKRAARLLSVPGERRLAPITAAFLIFGVFWGAFSVGTVDLERSFRVGNGGFGIALSVALLAATVGNALGGPAAERWGVARVLSAALTAWGALLLAGAAVPSAPELLGLAVATGGLVDVSMNVAASSALSAGHLARFHGRFNAGAAAGGALMGVCVAGGLGWRPVWLATGAGGLMLAGWSARAPLPASSPGESVPLAGIFSVLRRDGLVVLAVAFALAAMVEGGLDLWGVLYLRSRLHSGLLVGAGGAVAAYLIAATARSMVGERAGRRGPQTGIIVGAALAGIGAAVMAASSSASLGAAGLVIAAGSVSLCWPLFVARAASGKERPGEAVGAVSSFGYLGLVGGPAVVGSVAAAAGLRAGLAFLAGSAAVVAGLVAVVSRYAARSRRGVLPRAGPLVGPPAASGDAPRTGP